jgi:hypothetical protein
MRENNNKLVEQNEIFKTFLRQVNPGVSFEGDDALEILKSIYINGCRLVSLLDRERILETHRLPSTLSLCDQIRRSIDQLSEILPWTNNYFNKGYKDEVTLTHADGNVIEVESIVVTLYKVCTSLQAWNTWHSQAAQKHKDDIQDAYTAFTQMTVSKLLTPPDAWGMQKDRL